jgi:uncharacterized membrane protein YagU involved in acid resistance
VKMSPMWFWLQVVTFAFIIAGAVIAIVKLA